MCLNGVHLNHPEESEGAVHMKVEAIHNGIEDVLAN